MESSSDMGPLLKLLNTCMQIFLKPKTLKIWITLAPSISLAREAQTAMMHQGCLEKEPQEATLEVSLQSHRGVCFTLLLYFILLVHESPCTKRSKAHFQSCSWLPCIHTSLTQSPTWALRLTQTACWVLVVHACHSQSGRQRQEEQRNSGPVWDTTPYLYPIQQ